MHLINVVNGKDINVQYPLRLQMLLTLSKTSVHQDRLVTVLRSEGKHENKSGLSDELLWFWEGAKKSCGPVRNVLIPPPPPAHPLSLRRLFFLIHFRYAYQKIQNSLD